MNQDARLARELSDRLQRCEELQAAFDLLNSEERTEFEELCDENCAQFDWTAIRQSVRDGSMSAEQADKWLNKLALALEK